MANLKKEIHIQYGQYQCWLSRRWGYFINVPGIARWGIDDMTEYIEFLKLMILERQKRDVQNQKNKRSS
jgi:hypothetical protein